MIDRGIAEFLDYVGSRYKAWVLCAVGALLVVVWLVWAFRYNRKQHEEMAAEEAAAVERNSPVAPPLVALQPQDPVSSPGTNLTRLPQSAAAPGTVSLSPGQVGVASPAPSVPTAPPEGESVVYATNYVAAIEEAKRRHRGAGGATNPLSRGPGPILGPSPPRQ